MANFDKKNHSSGDKFIRHDPQMLQHIFGTVDVEPYWVADMDFAVADPIRDELKRLASRGQFAYEFDSEGVYQAITNWFARRNDLNLNADSFVQVPGVLTALALMVRELTEPGDGVLIQTPAFHQFAKVISTAGRTVVKNPLKIVNDRYEIDFDDLEIKLGSGDAKILILCNPHNPVGRVWTKEEVKKTIELADKHGITIVSDEIFSDIIMPGHTFNSIMSLDDGKHVALIGAPSKTFGMQSITNGYIYTTNAEILGALKETVDSMYLGHGNAFTTFATIAAFKSAEAWVDEFVAYVHDTATWIDEYLRENLSSVQMYMLEGTYQIWLSFAATGLSADELKEEMGKAKMGMTPGSWFDSDNELFTRLNIASPRAGIQAAFRRMKSALDHR